MNNPTINARTIRWQLLSTVSSFALLTSVCAASQAQAADVDQPQIWIELGAEMNSVTGQGEPFAPAFLAKNSTSPVLQKTTPLQAQQLAKISFGEEGRISFQPEDSNWVFFAAIHYGRSSGRSHVDHQTDRLFYKYAGGAPTTAADFAKTQASRQENHAILDFQAGKDVGLGLFGRGSSSILSVGVRFAQFASKQDFNIRARPDLHTPRYFTFYTHRVAIKYFHTYYVTGHASRNFRGVGPSVSWNGSTPFAGNLQDGEVTFDWGANAAILFGKQRVLVRHQESAHYHPAGFSYSPYYMHPIAGLIDARSVIVPNAGGSLGISFRRGDAKISIGYRADMFFNAMDGGIDARKSENVGFYGPFAAISVGLGG
jgi:hypothetical protein